MGQSMQTVGKRFTLFDFTHQQHYDHGIMQCLSVQFHRPVRDASIYIIKKNDKPDTVILPTLLISGWDKPRILLWQWKLLKSPLSSDLIIKSYEKNGTHCHSSKLNCISQNNWVLWFPITIGDHWKKYNGYCALWVVQWHQNHQKLLDLLTWAYA